MSRTTILVLVALGAALAGFAFSTAARQLQDEESAAEASVAAGPQTAALGWRETHGPPGEQLVFSVESLEVVPGGWRVKLALENRSSVAFALGDPQATLNRSFGLMLFSTGKIEELTEQNANNTLPAVRPATTLRTEAARDPGTGSIVEGNDLCTGRTGRRKLGARRVRSSRLRRQSAGGARGERRVDHRPRVPAPRLTVPSVKRAAR